ncbi:F-box protein At3g07870-like [Papaver somniferum]|uniref:F-box protein At3g07870-like n=1 Tax=Papaver somniferum TaxID=3469 RepID=UPI000E6FA0AF|nr:F-box protein At3g07870-like [Papaver somniferum]
MLPQSQGKDFLTGFGYSPSTNKYKVVRIYNGIVEVFTLCSGIGWRNVGKMDYDVPVWNEYCGTFVDGAIHWMDKKGTIFAFDLADEEFHELPSLPCLPRAGLIPSLSISLHVLGNLLCALHLNKESWEIWSLKKHKNHQHVFWSEEFSDVNDINIHPVIFTKSGGLLCYDKNDKNVYRYAPEASSPRMLVNFGDSVTFFGFPHKNTFVSLKALGEEDTKLMDLGESAKSSRETESIDHQPTEKKDERDL